MNSRGAKLVVSVALAGSLALVAGCSAASTQKDASLPEPGIGEPSLMPVNHAGRFETLGAPGCYGCHGAGKSAPSQLADATPLPDDHYVNNDPATREVFGARGECITCHPQG